MAIFKTAIINQNCIYKLRPNAGHGLWLCLLLPIAYLINSWKHKSTLEFQYKFTTIVAFGLAIQCICIFLKLNSIKSSLWSVATLITSFLIWICLKQGIFFSILIGSLTMIGHYILYFNLLKEFPLSFTLGEASILSQGFILFLLNAFLRFVDYNVPQTMMDKMVTILQVTFLGVFIIILATYKCRIFRGFPFYALTGSVVIGVLCFPLSEHNVFETLLIFVFGDAKRICTIILWIGLLGATTSGMAWHIQHHQITTTRTRKYFHLLIVAVFIPGLLFECTFLFVASGLLLAAFILLETIRIIQLAPFNRILNVAIQSFIDEKDAGSVALTPIYLLTGFTMPLWLHPCSCDLTDSAGFNLMPLLAGVISVGVGDTVASVVGSKFGRHKWTNTPKSIEGTLASVICQSMVWPLCYYFGLVNWNVFKVITFEAAVICNALIEAKTSQVDNLVLPIITFCILSL